MNRRRLALALAAVAALGIALSALVFARGRAGEFAERRVDVASLPPMAQDEVRAHGGGRCVEERPTIFRCALVNEKQAHEGRSGRVWCFDGDGPQTLSMYPAHPEDGAWSCIGPRTIP